MRNIAYPRRPRCFLAGCIHMHRIGTLLLPRMPKMLLMAFSIFTFRTCWFFARTCNCCCRGTKQTQITNNAINHFTFHSQPHIHPQTKEVLNNGKNNNDDDNNNMASNNNNQKLQTKGNNISSSGSFMHAGGILILIHVHILHSAFCIHCLHLHTKAYSQPHSIHSRQR